jgi:hypothetical protein
MKNEPLPVNVRRTIGRRWTQMNADNALVLISVHLRSSAANDFFLASQGA